MNEKLLAFANKSNVEQKNVEQKNADGKANDSETRYKWLTNWASEHNVELNDRDKVDSNGIRYVHDVDKKQSAQGKCWAVEDLKSEASYRQLVIHDKELIALLKMFHIQPLRI